MIDSSLSLAETALQAAHSVGQGTGGATVSELATVAAATTAAAAAAAAAATIPAAHRPVQLERALFQLLARNNAPSLTEAARLADDGGLGSLARAMLQRARAVLGGGNA